MVLTRVDFPSPVCPGSKGQSVMHYELAVFARLTNDHNIELETSLQKLVLNLVGD